jgi:translation initiation factor 1 (eIF-1/SUI1)
MDYTCSVEQGLRLRVGVILKDAAKLIRKEKATGGAVTKYEQDPSQECLELQGDLRTYIPEFISKHYPDIPETAINVKEVADDVKKKK